MSDWLWQVLAAVGEVWAFRVPQPVLDNSPDALAVAIGVAVLAGLSTMVGHAVVFTINHVSGPRMAVGMALGALYVTTLRALTAGAIAILATLIMRGAVDGGAVAMLYLIAVAPHVLGFLVFLPYLGLGIGRLLEAWTVVALVAMLSQTLSTGIGPALAIGGGAWLAGQLLSRIAGRPLAAVSSRVWTLATGQPTFLTAHDILSGAPFIPLHRKAGTP